MADDTFNSNTAYLTACKQDGSYRRCNGTYGQVVAKYDTKLNCIHSKACADRQKDWSEDQDCWCRIHESTYKQKDNVN